LPETALALDAHRLRHRHKRIYRCRPGFARAAPERAS
jgi:hypothetical protein